MKDLNFLRSNGFDVEKLVNELGTELYDQVLEDFYNEVSVKIEKLTEFLNNNDLVNYSIYVHNIKSECLYLGINNLANICYTHELKSKANDGEYVREHYNDVINETNRVLTLIKVYLGK